MRVYILRNTHISRKLWGAGEQVPIGERTNFTLVAWISAVRGVNVFLTTWGAPLCTDVIIRRTRRVTPKIGSIDAMTALSDCYARGVNERSNWRHSRFVCWRDMG